MTKGAAKHERVAAEKEAKKRTEEQAKQAKKINELDGEISELKAGAAKPTGKPGNNAPISDEERARRIAPVASPCNVPGRSAERP